MTLRTTNAGVAGASAPLRNVARYWPLLVNLTRREMRQRYKGSALGLLWTLITPAIMIGAYTLVFRYVFRIQIENYALFIFIGLTFWQLFFGSVTVATSSLVGQPGLVTRVRFPRSLITLATMGGNSLTGFAMLAVALITSMAVIGVHPALVSIPLLLVLTAMLTAGLGLVAAAIQVYFRDVEHILAAIGLPWIFLSPIFYTFDKAPGLSDNALLENILHWANPPAPLILSFQAVLYDGTWPAGGDLLYSLVAATAMLAIGIAVFRRLEPEMAAEL